MLFVLVLKKMKFKFSLMSNTRRWSWAERLSWCDRIWKRLRYPQHNISFSHLLLRSKYHGCLCSSDETKNNTQHPLGNHMPPIFRIKLCFTGKTASHHSFSLYCCFVMISSCWLALWLFAGSEFVETRKWIIFLFQSFFLLVSSFLSRLRHW